MSCATQNPTCTCGDELAAAHHEATTLRASLDATRARLAEVERERDAARHEAQTWKECASRHMSDEEELIHKLTAAEMRVREVERYAERGWASARKAWNEVPSLQTRIAALEGALREAREAVRRYIVAQGPRLPDAWFDLLTEKCGLVADAIGMVSLPARALLAPLEEPEGGSRVGDAVCKCIGMCHNNGCKHFSGDYL